MNSGWFELKLHQDQRKMCGLSLKGWAPPLSNKLCHSKQRSGSYLLNAKYLDLRKGLKDERMSSYEIIHFLRGVTSQ